MILDRRARVWSSDPVNRPGQRAPVRVTRGNPGMRGFVEASGSRTDPSTKGIHHGELRPTRHPHHRGRRRPRRTRRRPGGPHRVRPAERARHQRGREHAGGPLADGRRRARRRAPQPVPVHAARRRAVHGDRARRRRRGRRPSPRTRSRPRPETTEPGEARDSSENTEADESEATEADPAESTESTEAAPAAATPAPTTQGLLPSIPGSPVAAQASPQVAGADPSSALQSLDAGSMF